MTNHVGRRLRTQVNEYLAGCDLTIAAENTESADATVQSGPASPCKTRRVSRESQGSLHLEIDYADEEDSNDSVLWHPLNVTSKAASRT